MKKIKYYLGLSLFLIGFLFSCDKIELGSFIPENGEIEFANGTVAADNTLDTLWVNVKSNLPFRLKSTASWVSYVTPNSMSSTSVGIIVGRNRDLNERSAIVTAYITDEVYAELELVQAAGEPAPDYTRHFYVKENGVESADGLSWANSTTLNKALDEAASGDYIHVAEGKYIPTKSLVGGSTSSDVTFAIYNNIRLIGGYPANAEAGVEANSSLYVTELNGDSKAHHVVTILAPKVNEHYVELSGIKITKGLAGGSGSVLSSGLNVSRQHGGGLLILKSKVLIENTSIIENGTNNHAAGVFITGGADVTMNKVSIKDNYATIAASNAGGIWNDESRLVMYDSEIIGNRIGGVGAGLYSFNAVEESLTILYNVTIARNVCGIFGNNAVGGGIYARQKSNFYIINSTIYGNQAGGSNFGGGIALHGGVNFHLISSTVSGNQSGVNATSAGGVAIHNASASNNNLSLYNSIVSGNVQSNFPDLGGSTFASYTVKSSIIGNQIYNYDGLVAGNNFDYVSAFDTFGSAKSFGESLPLKGTSSAVTEGMSTLQLEILNSNIGILEISKFMSDQHGKSRSGKKTMGSDVTVK